MNSKFIIRSVLLFTVPSVALYPQTDIPVAITASHKTEFLSQSLQSDLSYDDIINLMHHLEHGKLEQTCNQAELEKIHYLLISLARRGIFFNEVAEELALESDIQKLLYDEELPCEYAFSFNHDQKEILLCKSHSNKKENRTRKFIRKHKKAIIIGTVVVIAVGVIIYFISRDSKANAVSTGAGAAGAAGGAAVSGSNSDCDKKEKDASKIKDEPVSTYSPAKISTNPSSICSITKEDAILQSIIQEHIFSICKEVVTENDLLSTPDYLDHKNPSFGENVRNFSAALAHEVLDGASDLASCIPQLFEEMKTIKHKLLPDILHSPNGVEITPMKNYEELVAAVHKKIDEVFTTEQAQYYTPEAKAAKERRLENFTIGVLPPPNLFTKGINLAKIRAIIAARQETALLAKELGLTLYEVTRLKEAGVLERSIATTFEGVIGKRAMTASLERFKNAITFLRPYKGQYFPEMQVRELIHQTGIRTFPRPRGIPENFKIKVSNNGAGMKYVHPENNHTSVRVMPGKPHSPYPYQRSPYIIQMKDGKVLDKLGNQVSSKAPEAHIPIEVFIYRD